jgi:hypothetical protein
MMMADIRPILLGNPNIQHVSATRKSETIGRWDVILDGQHQSSVRQDITTNIDQWIKDIPTDPNKPEDFPPPGIASRGVTERDTSSQGSQGGVSYLSSSAGSYSSMMENDEDDQYNSAPQQRTRNSVSVSGFSWAQVAARPPKRTTTTSHISELTAPTQATQAQSIEMNELKSQVKEMAGQLKRFEDLIILLTTRLPQAPSQQNQQQQEPYYQQQSFQQHQPRQQQQQQQQQQPFDQYQQNQWQNQQPQQQTQQMQVYQQATPPRQNGRSQDPRFPIQGNRMQNQQPPQKVHSPPQLQNANGDFQEPPAKRSDDKPTPNKQNATAPETNNRIMTNPYNQPRQIQQQPAQINHELHPSQYAHNVVRANGTYPDGRNDALIYSQEPGTFRYTPPSQEDELSQRALYPYHDQIQGPYQHQNDTHMHDNNTTSHPAEDARSKHAV